MANFEFLSKNKKNLLPQNTGVYLFCNNKKILYIGKAINIKERVKNHFQGRNYKSSVLLKKTNKFGYIITDSEIEALLLEASLIKKYQPKFNVMWRDDKNYFYVVITKEKLPRVFITHQPVDAESRIRNQESGIKRNKSRTSLFIIHNSKFQYIGPFVDGNALKQTLRFLRKIFPYYSVKKHSKEKCLYCHLGLCPGFNPDIKEYKKNIVNLKKVLIGKQKSVLAKLKKEMSSAAKKENFESAAKIKSQIFYLQKVISHARILKNISIPYTNIYYWKKIEGELRDALRFKNIISRIEGYDISNIQGKEAVGSMVVFVEGKPAKNFYRKFKIKTIKQANDTAMIKEVLKRRLTHKEWTYPQLILIDGGKAQLNTALNVLNQYKSAESVLIRVIALAKKDNKLYVEGRKKPILLKNLSQETSNLILNIRDEAHRFALSYHHKLRMIDLKLKS